MRMKLYRHTPVFMNRYKKRGLINKFMFCFVCFILLTFIYLFFERIYPNYISRVEIYANNLATSTINKTLSEVLQTKYSEFVNISADKNGTVTSVEANTLSMNTFKADFIDTLQKRINELPDGSISIPLGSLSNKEIFSGFGPKIKIKTVPNGIVRADFSEEFVSCGINQVKHKIFLDVSVTITLASAAMYKTQTVHTAVPISETIIGGTVPNYYGGNLGLTAMNPENK